MSKAMSFDEYQELLKRLRGLTPAQMASPANQILMAGGQSEARPGLLHFN